MNLFSTQVGVNDEMESSSEPENDSSDQLQATPILLGIMMITMMIVKMKQWLTIFDDNDDYVDDNNNGEIAVKQRELRWS